MPDLDALAVPTGCARVRPMSVSADDVEAWLRSVANTLAGPFLRPFTPDTNWRRARVFVVGTNPATPLRDEFGSFDAYWHALTQDPAAFHAAYQARRGGPSTRTAGRVERFAAPLAGIGVLRANAACLPAPRWRKLPAAVRREQLAIGREVLRALIETCRPAAILCHGAVGVTAVSGLFGTILDPRVPLDRQDARAALTSGAMPVRLFAYPHLSGMGARGFRVGRMTDEVEALGQRLAKELGV